jgi:hypothetical protein
VDETVKDAMFEYGRHLGLAFQVVDDILDFTQTTEQLGKPQVCIHTRPNVQQSPAWSIFLCDARV